MPQSRTQNLGLLIHPVGHVQVQKTLSDAVKALDNLAGNGGGGGSSYTDADAVEAVAAAIDVDSLELVTAPDATDEATAVTLANANKAAINALIAAIKGLAS